MNDSWYIVTASQCLHFLLAGLYPISIQPLSLSLSFQQSAVRLGAGKQFPVSSTENNQSERQSPSRLTRTSKICGRDSLGWQPPVCWEHEHHKGSSLFRQYQGTRPFASILLCRGCRVGFAHPVPQATPNGVNFFLSFLRSTRYKQYFYQLRRGRAGWGSVWQTPTSHRSHKWQNI